MADITIVFMGFINQQTSLGGTILYRPFMYQSSRWQRYRKGIATVARANLNASIQCHSAGWSDGDAFLKWLFNPWVVFKGRHFCQKMGGKKNRLIEFLLGIYLLVDPTQPQADRQAIRGWITPIIPYLRGWAYTHLSYSGVFAEGYPGFGTYAMY